MELNREFQRRKDFLSLTPEDERALRGLHSLLGDQTPGFVESFYDHLLSFGETRALIPDESTLNRLKRPNPPTSRPWWQACMTAPTLKTACVSAWRTPR